MTFTTAFTVGAHTQTPAEYREPRFRFLFEWTHYYIQTERSPWSSSPKPAPRARLRALRAPTVRMTAAHLNMTPPQISHVTCPFLLGGETLGATSKFCFLEHQAYTHSSKNDAVRCGMKSRVLLEVHEFLKALELIRVSQRLAFLPEVWENHKDSGLDFHTSAWWVKKTSSVFLWRESSLNFHLSESHIKLPITPCLPLQLTHFGF